MPPSPLVRSKPGELPPILKLLILACSPCLTIPLSINEAKIRQISELNIKYQTTKKDDNIKLLQSQGDRQQAELQKISVERNLTVVGVLLLTLIP